MLEKHVIFPFFLYKLHVFCELHLFAEYYIRFGNYYMFGVSSASSVKTSFLLTSAPVKHPLAPAASESSCLPHHLLPWRSAFKHIHAYSDNINDKDV